MIWVVCKHGDKEFVILVNKALAEEGLKSGLYLREATKHDLSTLSEWKRRIMFNQTTPAYREQDLRPFAGPDSEPIEAVIEILRPGGQLCYWTKEGNHDQ